MKYSCQVLQLYTLYRYMASRQVQEATDATMTERSNGVSSQSFMGDKNSSLKSTQGHVGESKVNWRKVLWTDDNLKEPHDHQTKCCV